MANYRYRTPRFPKLHRCEWCRQRLNKDMQIVVAESFWGDEVTVDCYYCDRSCAQADYDFQRIQARRTEALNEYIKGR